MKKKDYIVILLFISIIGMGFLFFNKTEEDRMPDKGIYFLKQKSFYAINPIEEPTITLDWCEVSNNMDSVNDTYKIGGYYRLKDDVGEEYDITIDEDSVINENRIMKLGKGLVMKKYRANVDLDINKDVKIVAIKYTDEMDKTVIQNIGCIQLHFVDNVSEKLDFFSNRIDWEANLQPTFNHAELYISNEEAENVMITSIYYGKNGIGIKSDERFMIKAGESKLLDIEIELNEKEGEPIIYYLKPCIKYLCNEREIEIASNNVSRESYYGTSDEMREYLYSMTKVVSNEL